MNLEVKPDQINDEVIAMLKSFNDDNKGNSNYMFNLTDDVKSLQAVIFNSPLVSLGGSKETEGGT